MLTIRFINSIRQNKVILEPVLYDNHVFDQFIFLLFHYNSICKE